MPSELSVENENIYPASEDRVVRRLSYFWKSMLRGRAFPPMSSLDPRRLPIGWDHCFLLAIIENADDPPLDYVGEYLRRECGRDPTNLPVSKVPVDTLLEKSAQPFKMALQKQAPYIVEGNFRHARGVNILYRSILLPLGDGPDIIDYLLGGVSCCELQDNERKAA